MATLKHVNPEVNPKPVSEYPCMKIHGNIEALKCPVLMAWPACVSMYENPWQHWSCSTFCHWLYFLQVSMYENPWQHWSLRGDVLYPSVDPCIHVWKSMATLKPVRDVSFPHSSVSIHVWKSMATLKRSWRTLLLLPLSGYPCMKIHGNIEAKKMPGETKKVKQVSMYERDSFNVAMDFHTWIQV